MICDVRLDDHFCYFLFLNLGIFIFRLLSENESIKENFCCSVTEIQVLLFILSYASLDLNCLFMADTLHSFIHHWYKSFNNSVCKYNVHFYTALQWISVLKFYVSPDTEPLESINSVIAVRLVTWFFCCCYCLVSQKFSLLIGGDSNCSEETESKPFGLF